MPEYVYRAVTDKGLIVKNKVEESSKQSLIRKLKHNNLTPIQVVQVGYMSKKQKKKKRNISNMEDIMKTANSSNVFNGDARKKVTLVEKLNLMLDSTEKITNRDLVIFTQNFYLLKKANFNNIHALNTIIESTENMSLRGILEDILAGVEGGDYMYTTMEYYSNIFPYIYINMIKVGELSGSLTNSLQQAVRYLDNSADISKRVKKIVIPNVLELIGLLIMLIAGTLIAVPAIQGVYDKVGSKDTLPGITLAFSDFVNATIAHWYIPTSIIVGLVVGVTFYINTPKGKYNFHYFKYTMPIFGKLMYGLDFSRFIKAMLLNLDNGMRIQDALEVSKNVVNNYVFLSMVETSINNILIGQSWIEPFEKSGLSSAMTTEMLKIGMKTDLSEMMQKLVEYMEMDINAILDKIMKVMPQVMYSIVGIVLIFFVLVILVPMIGLYMGNFMFSAAGV
ncbi:MAG: type II secretion system F family protein [Clostridiaceae bacterium]|nr:type II secretion system F family protein [Clostridiaceae bacterium]